MFPEFTTSRTLGNLEKFGYLTDRNKWLLNGHFINLVLVSSLRFA